VLVVADARAADVAERSEEGVEGVEGSGERVGGGRKRARRETGGGEGVASAEGVSWRGRHEEGGVTSVAWAQDGDVVVSGGEDGVCVVWDGRSGVAIRRFVQSLDGAMASGTRCPVAALAVVSVGRDEDPATACRLTSLRKHLDPIVRSRSAWDAADDTRVQLRVPASSLWTAAPGGGWNEEDDEAVLLRDMSEPARRIAHAWTHGEGEPTSARPTRAVNDAGEGEATALQAQLAQALAQVQRLEEDNARWKRMNQTLLDQAAHDDS
jgi:hypothetical protein